MPTTTAQAGVCNVPNRTIFEEDNLDVMRGINDEYAAPVGSRAAGAAFRDTWDLLGGFMGDPPCEPSKDAEQGLESSEQSCIDFKGKLATTEDDI